MMQLVFSTDDNYIMPTGILIYSIEKNNPTSTINYNVIGSHLSTKSKNMLQACLINKTSTITFYEINEDLLKKCPIRLKDHVTLPAYYRILFQSIFPNSIQKILYIDGDTLCLSNIEELWNTNIDNYSAGVIIDVYSSDIRRINRLDLQQNTEYFNTGLMLINLSYWRENDIQNKTLKFINDFPEKCIAHDQDALNKTLENTVLYLHPKYNLQLDFWLPPEKLFIKKEHYNKIKESCLKPCILHFTGNEKPWHIECIYPLKDLWTHYKNQTQWKKLKKVHKYKGKRLLKYYLRLFLEKIKFLEKQNPYKNLDIISYLK